MRPQTADIDAWNAATAVVKVDPSVRAKLAKGAGVIWEKWVKDQEAEGRPGKEILDFVKATVKKHSN